MRIIKTTYKDQVIDHIYNLIIEGSINHGDQIKESWLSKEMGISRAPIREALKELISNGIIHYKPQIGNFLAQPSPQETIDAYITRGVLEGYAVMETCNRFTNDEISGLEAMTAVMQNAAEEGNHKRVVSIGGDFHDNLVSKSKNSQLVEYTERLSKKLHILFFKHWSQLYSPEEIGRRHHEIVDSLKTKTPAEIEKVIRNHYTETGNKIADLQRSSEMAKQGR